MPDWQEADYRSFETALRRLSKQTDLIQKLKIHESAEETSKVLRISEEVRMEIIELLNDFELYFHESPVIHEKAGSAQPNHKAENPGPSSEIDNAREFFKAAFTQLRGAYETSRMMSITMFIMGILFLGIAAASAILRPENVATNSVIGGIGIVQMVAIFYRNPLADIGRAVSNAQQAKIAITSYLIGITLIHDSIGLDVPTNEHIKNLLQVTDRTIKQLQKYTEDDARENNSTRTSDKPEK
jgi:hypothetical protein